MLKKAILIVTAATFAPTGSFAHDHLAVRDSPFVGSVYSDTLYLSIIEETPWGNGEHIEIAKICNNSIIITAGGADAETPLDLGEGPINGTNNALMRFWAPDGADPCI